jgi:hypothetical protein
VAGTVPQAGTVARHGRGGALWHAQCAGTHSMKRLSTGLHCSLSTVYSDSHTRTRPRAVTTADSGLWVLRAEARGPRRTGGHTHVLLTTRTTALHGMLVLMTWNAGCCVTRLLFPAVAVLVDKQEGRTRTERGVGTSTATRHVLSPCVVSLRSRFLLFHCCLSPPLPLLPLSLVTAFLCVALVCLPSLLAVYCYTSGILRPTIRKTTPFAFCFTSGISVCGAW